VGHSWGGHLALHAATALPERVAAVLCVDPLGGVGDGGEAGFEAELDRRTPEDVRRQAAELDARAMRGEGTEADAELALRLVWPAYFPTWEDAPPMQQIRLSVAAYAETFESLHAELPALEQALPSVEAPVGFVVGGDSPMPTSASLDTADRIPGAWVEVVDGAGHFPWLDAPGRVRSALDRLTS
jgi:pimeloyl-ACP methyl ester carboxylesterase